MESTKRDEQNSSLKESSKCYPRRPKVVPKAPQNRTRRPPESRKPPDDCPGPKKTNFGGRVLRRCTPEGVQIGLSNEAKTIQNQEFIPYAKKTSV